MSFSLIKLKKTLKKGFTLVELAIVIAVIAALSVTFAFSDKIVDNAKATKIMQNIYKAETNIEEFYQILNSYPMMFSFKDCLESELNTKNICRAAYCLDENELSPDFNTNQPCSGLEYDEYRVFAPAYWMNQFMSVSEYFNTTGIKTENGEYKAKNNFYSNNNLSNIKTNLEYAIAAATPISPNQILSIGTANAQGELDNIAVATSDIAGHSKAKNSIIISIANKEITQKAAFSADFSYLLDVKFDDGKPNTGNIIASKHRIKPECYDGSLNCGGSGIYQKIGNTEETHLDGIADYACYNTNNAGTTSNSNWLITESDKLEYTGHAKTDYSETVDITETVKGLKKSEILGCDMHYISKHKVR
jgi:prepilin-type N-terminal cleavage/methylation domain-containing protein